MKKWIFILLLVCSTGFAQVLEVKDSTIVLVQPNQQNDVIKITDADFAKLRTITHKDNQWKVSEFSIHAIVKGEYIIYNNLTRITDAIHKVLYDGKATEINFEKVKLVNGDKKQTCNFTFKLQITH